MGRRRLHGDGLPERVYAHKNGFIYRPPTGKAVMLGATRLDALAEYSRLTGKGAIVPAARSASKLTIGDCVDHLVATHLPHLSEDTQRQYLRYLTMIRAALGDLAPDRLKPRDIYEFMDGVTDSGPIRNVILAQFRNIYKLAIRKGACETNPAREVSREPTPGRDRVPTLPELDAFMRFAGPWWECWVVFKLLTGLRQRDMISLKPIPLNAETFTVEISKTKRWRKSEGARRGRRITYRVTEDVREVLRRLYALKRPQSTEALFCSAFGHPYKPRGFMDAWRRKMNAAVAAGKVARFHEHDIRATVATLDPRGARDRLGHVNQSTTDLYIRQLQGKTVDPLDVELVQEPTNLPDSGRNIHLLFRQKASGDK